MNITNGKTAERISLQTEIDLQIFTGGEVRCNAVSNTEKQWPMKKQDQKAENSRRDPRYASPSKALLHPVLMSPHGGPTVFPSGQRANYGGWPPRNICFHPVI